MINNKMKHQLSKLLKEDKKQEGGVTSKELVEAILKTYADMNKLEKLLYEYQSKSAKALGINVKRCKNSMLKYAHFIDGDDINDNKQSVQEDFSVDVDDMKDRKVEKQVTDVINNKKKEVRLTNKIDENLIVEKLTVGEMKKRNLLK